jgi:signal transduction histidine kinase
MDPSIEYLRSAGVSDVGWSSWLTDRIGICLRVLADTAEPDTSAFGEVVRQLAAFPGVTDAHFTPLAGSGMTSGSLRVLAGAAHLLELTGPSTVRPDVVQGVGVVATAMLSRLGRAPLPPNGFPPAGPAETWRGLELRTRERDDLARVEEEFLATVSHELRTPLTSVSSLLELLADDDAADPVSAEIVHVLRRNVQRLVGTVEELLLLVRIESDQLPLDRHPVETSALLGHLLEPLRTEAAGRGVSLRTRSDESEPTVRVLGDPYWLERMIRYLVSGSFASGHPGTITVRGAVHDGCWTLTVSGDSSRTTERPLAEGPHNDSGIGVGVGVVMARAIVKRHGGELRIERGLTLTRIRIRLAVI